MTTDRSTNDVIPSRVGAGYYRILLLTFWLEDADMQGDPETWRFRLEDPRTGKRQGAVGLSALVALLKEKIADETLSKKHETD